MGCSSCGGGRRSGSSYTPSSGRGTTGSWRMTFASGAELVYTDQSRAERDFEALKTHPDPGSRADKLEKINPVTGAVLTS